MPPLPLRPDSNSVCVFSAAALAPMPVPACKRSAEDVSLLAASARVIAPVLATMLSLPVPASATATTTLPVAERRTVPPPTALALRTQPPAAIVRLPLPACKSRLPPALSSCAVAASDSAPAASTERLPPWVDSPAFRLIAAAEPVVCSNTFPASNAAIDAFTVRVPTVLRSTTDAAPGTTPVLLSGGASASMPLSE